VKKAHVKSFLPTGKVKKLFVAAVGDKPSSHKIRLGQYMDSSWRERPNMIDDCTSQEIRAELHNFVLPN
jgi:hypothetical protein